VKYKKALSGLIEKSKFVNFPLGWLGEGSGLFLTLIKSTVALEEVSIPIKK
jgi:hypothetical protein